MFGSSVDCRHNIIVRELSTSQETAPVVRGLKREIWHYDDGWCTPIDSKISRNENIISPTTNTYYYYYYHRISNSVRIVSDIIDFWACGVLWGMFLRRSMSWRRKKKKKKLQIILNGNINTIEVLVNVKRR